MAMIGRRAAGWLLSGVVGVALVSGCATPPSSTAGSSGVVVSDPSRMTRSGFLSDYKRLQKASWSDGIECWRDPKVNVQKYDKVLIPRIVVTLQDDQAKGVDPADLKVLTDYFHAALTKALKAQMQIVDKQGRDVVVMRVALTQLVPTGVAQSVTGTVIPFAFVAEAGAGVATERPVGSTPYMGQTGVEMQFLDGASGAILAECRDSEIGRKYAADLDSGAAGAAQTWASGYLNSFQSWSYAKNAFDKWSELTAKRFAELRAAK